MPKNMKIFRGPFRGQRTNIFFGAIHHKSPNFMGNKVVWVPVGLGGDAGKHHLAPGLFLLLTFLN